MNCGKKNYTDKKQRSMKYYFLSYCQRNMHAASSETYYVFNQVLANVHPFNFIASLDRPNVDIDIQLISWQEITEEEKALWEKLFN